MTQAKPVYMDFRNVEKVLKKQELIRRQFAPVLFISWSFTHD